MHYVTGDKEWETLSGQGQEKLITINSVRSSAQSAQVTYCDGLLILVFKMGNGFMDVSFGAVFSNLFFVSRHTLPHFAITAAHHQLKWL